MKLVKLFLVTLVTISVFSFGLSVLAIEHSGIAISKKDPFSPISLKDKNTEFREQVDNDNVEGLKIAQATEQAAIDVESRIKALEKQIAELKESLKSKSQEQKKEDSKNHLSLGPITKAKFSGYAQVRAYDSQTTTNKPENRTVLEPRRIRLGFAGDVGEKAAFAYTFDLGGSGTVSTRDAYIDYKFYPWLLGRAGQFKIPYTHEQLLSGADVLFERSIAHLRLFPGARDRGFMWDADLKKFIHMPLSFQLGVINGTGRNIEDNNGAKDLFAILLFKQKYYDIRAGFQNGRFNFEHGDGKEIQTRKQRATVSFHSNFGLGKDKLWDGYGAYLWGHGDYPGGKNETEGTLGITGTFNPQDVNGYNIVLTRRLYKDSPFTLWSKYDRYDPNIHSSGNTIDIVSYGTKLDFTSYFSVLAGVFHKNFHSIKQDTSLGLQTQLRF